MQLTKYIYALVALSFLIGCGDDQEYNITEITKLGLDVVSKKTDLPECDSDIEGKFVWVTSEERSYLCNDESWFVYTEGSVPKDHSIECSTKELKDGSGVQVVCNGDSIGVLRYVSNADKESSKCTLRMLSSDSLKLECGNSSRLLSIDELLESMGGSYEVVVDSEQVAVRLENIGGYSQKGPFLTGSEVVAYEIENGRTMKQTGIKFEGRISNDDGSFNIRSVKLASQYGFVSVNGFYLNEVSGNVSNARITLNAVTDLRNRNRVNVNVLTHMEYERILYLVTKKKYRFAEAKKKAESEIWKIFRIDGEKFQDDAEDLNIAGSSDADAALLAVSIMLQRDGDSGDLLSLVTDIGNAIAEGEEWGNDSLDVAIADWALKADLLGEYEKIRNNVANWGITLKVADFEPYLRNYWQSVLEIPACTDKEDGSIAIVQNKNSMYYSNDGSKLTLKCNALENRWIALTDEEKDRFEWNDTLDGALKPGNVRSDVIYLFDSTGAYDGNKGWRQVMSATELQFGGCRKSAFGDTVFVKEYGRSFVCDEKTHLWKGTFALSVVDTSAWPRNSDGDVKSTDFNTRCFVYENQLGFWRETRDSDCSLGLMGCTEARVGEISYSSIEGRYFECSYRSMGMFQIGSYLITTEAECNRFCDSMRVEGIPYENCGLLESVDFIMDIWGLNDSQRELEIDYLSKLGEDQGSFVYCAAKVKYPSWSDISEAKYDRFGDECKGRETFWGLLDSNNLYACKGDKMVLVNDMEKRLGQYCYEGVEGLLSRNYKYICHYVGHFPSNVDTDWRWELATVFDIPKGALSYFNDDLNYGTLKDPRDGKTYKTIDIEGSGTWMAENLNFRDEKNYYNLRYNISCDPEDDSDCSHLGTIYSWTAAMNIDSKWDYESAAKMGNLIKSPHQGICLDGWHIPTTEEWLALVQVFQPEISSFEEWGRIDALRFKANNLNEWPDATNESGLSFLPMSGVVNPLFYSANGGGIEVVSGLYYKPAGTYGTVRCKKDD